MPDLITLSQAFIMNWAATLVGVLPFGYAFGAGMVSTVNPCGFAILPAYLSLYLGMPDEGFERSSPLLRAAKALLIGGVVTLGFVSLFAAVGIAIAAGAQFLVRVMPWAGLAMGMALVVMGLLMLLGRGIHIRWAMELATRVPKARGSTAPAFFLFGVGYALASLGCTLPVFLVVVGSAVAVRGLGPGLLQFVSYGLGMGAVLTLLTLWMALFKSATATYLKGLLPHITRISAMLVLVVGAYLVYYWLTRGGVLESFS